MSHRSRRRQRDRKQKGKAENSPVPSLTDQSQIRPLTDQSQIRPDGAKRWMVKIYLCSLIFNLLIFIATPSLLYYRLSAVIPATSVPLSGVDILSDCGEEVRGLVSLSPAFEQGDVKVDVAVLDAKTMLKKCRRFQFILPGNTASHRYLLPMRIPHGSPPGTVPTGPRIPLHDVRRSPYGFDVLTVNLDEVPDFTGSIEYLWIEGVQRRSYAEYEIALPFFAVKMGEEPERGVKGFRVSMPVRQPYHLKEQSIAQNGRVPLVDRNLYLFEVVRGNSILDLTFQDERLVHWKEIYQTILIGFLGAGLSLLAAEIVAIARNYETLR